MIVGCNLKPTQKSETSLISPIIIEIEGYFILSEGTGLFYDDLGPMAMIGDALRQAFMPKHEYESLREEDKAWGKLQRPFVMASMAFICLVLIVCTIISLSIVFPPDIGKRPFCSDERLQPLTINTKGGGDSDLFPGAFYLTDQETVDYYWMVVFLPSMLIFFVSVVYLVAGNRASLLFRFSLSSFGRS